jgi:hypothetical protein
MLRDGARVVNFQMQADTLHGRGAGARGDIVEGRRRHWLAFQYS